MRVQAVNVRRAVLVVFVSGCLLGLSGLIEPLLSATDTPSSTDQDHASTPAGSPNSSRKAREGKGNHPVRKACAEDVKKLCPDVKAGEGRIVQTTNTSSFPGLCQRHAARQASAVRAGARQVDLPTCRPA